MHKLFIVAAERSGDDLASGLIGALGSIKSDIKISGIGGAAMERAGVTSQMSIEGLSILGFVEGVKHYPLILRKVQDCTEKILASNPDAVILIDSWGFMVRVAKQLKKRGYQGKVIKYVAPQVWAMRAGRAKILARYIDLLLSIQPMDAPYFESHGLETVYVGNPVFDTNYRAGEANSFRHKYNIGDRKVISIWFGSRPSEIRQLTSSFCHAVDILGYQNLNVVFVAPVAENIRDLLLERIQAFDSKIPIVLVDESDKLDVMAASHAALACSGTVTTQLASAGVPTIVGYRLNALTYFIAKCLFKPSFISIVNIAADKALMPEFIQSDVTAAKLAGALNLYVSDETLRNKSSQDLIDQTNKMGAKNDHKVNDKAVRTILTALS